ncbi:hypothetical protein [Acetobacter vaccinii]|nr:hypothetical protein [Acetobacter vaccinii]
MPLPPAGPHKRNTVPVISGPVLIVMHLLLGLFVLLWAWLGWSCTN